MVQLAAERLEDRLTPAGSLDANFGNFGRTTTDLHNNTDVANAVTIDPQGRIVVAGSSLFGGDTDFAVARYLPNGTLDTSFNGSGFRTLDVAGNGHNDAATGVAIDSQGRIVLGGWAFNGTNDDFAAVRVNSNGTLDTTFNGTGQVITTIPSGGGEARANALVIDSQDRPILAGFAHIGSDDDFAVVRYKADGTLDTTFNGTGKRTFDVAGNGHDDHANGVALDSQGRIVAGGYAFNGTDNDFAVARFKADGTVDSTFNSGAGKVITNIAADDVGRGVAIDSLDRIVLAGYSFLGSDYDFEVARYTSAGVLDTSSFGFGGTVRDNITSGQNDFGTSVAIDPAGNILVGGYSFVPNDDDFAVARFTKSGVLDTTFGTNGNTTINFVGNDFANGVAVDSIGQAVLAGQNGAANIDFALTRVTGNQVAVSATVTDGVSKATVGGTVTYTITVANAGPDAAQLVQAADTFPAGLTGVTYTSAAAGGATGNTASGNGNIADALFLPSGASVTYTATGTVTGPAGGNLDNTATATPLGALDGNAADNSATDTDAVGTQPAFTSPAAATFTAGEPGTFTVVTTGTPAAALSATGLPPGVTLTDNGTGTGTLASTAGAVAGTFALTLAAANGFGTDATQAFALTVDPPVVVAPAALPAGQVGTTYSQTISASGPPGPFTFAVTSGTTDGLSLSSGGLLSGTPVAAGTFMFTVTATNGANESGNRAYTLTIDPAVAVAPAALPDGQVGTVYNQMISASGPPGPFTFTVTSGAPPAGLSLSSSGTLSGTPTGAGTASFTVTATNGANESGSQAYTLTVAPALLPVGRLLAVSGSATGTAEVYAPSASGQYANPPAATTPATVFPGFTGNVRTATGDFNGDGVEDTVLVTGPGTKTLMAVVSGKDGSILLPPSDPFGDANFTFGGFVAAGDIDHDGRAEWVVTPELRGGPRVVIFHLLPDGSFDLTSSQQKSLVANFFGIGDPSFRDGDRAALGDVNGDGILDVFSIAAFNGGPRTALYNGADVLTARAANRDPFKLTGDFFAAPSGQDEGRGGRSIAVGDVNGDGVADLIATGDNLLGTGNQIVVFSGADLIGGKFPGFGATPLANFAVGGQSPAALVSVAAVNADGDARADLAVGSGAGQPSLVKVYQGTFLSGTTEPTSTSLDPFGTTTLNGVFVG
jgi:uncharacterized delta-60 repeat protein/uncharacterized repeat protein (TIGR01451 family)